MSRKMNFSLVTCDVFLVITAMMVCSVFVQGYRITDQSYLAKRDITDSSKSKLEEETSEYDSSRRESPSLKSSTSSAASPPTTTFNNSSTEEDSLRASSNKLETKNNQVAVNNDNTVNVFSQRLSHSIFQLAPKSSLPNSDKTFPNFKTLIWSPFSVHQALLPLYHAADGETRQELRQLLFPITHGKHANPTNVNPSSGNLSHSLDHSDNINNADISEKAFTSTTGVFPRNDVSLNPDFVGTVQKEVKNVEIKAVDFGHRAEAANSINSWVNESTKGLIQSAVDETQVDPYMFMMIVNCVRFKASWKTRFDPLLTKFSNFYGVNGVQRVQMMKQIGTQKFAKFPIIYSSDYQHEDDSGNIPAPPFSVVEMPYADGGLVSLFILPETTEQIRATLEYIEQVGVAGTRKKLEYWDMELIMPKFKIVSDVDVKDALVKNGLKTLFSPGESNLSKLFANEYRSDGRQNSSKQLLPPSYLSSIVHRTVFETSEDGTVAAGLTAMSIVPLSALPQDRVFRMNLDKPFIVLLVKEDNTLVFEGVITDLIGQDLRNTNPVNNYNLNDGKLARVPPSKNSLYYPTNSEIKQDFDKLLNSNGTPDQQIEQSSANNAKPNYDVPPPPMQSSASTQHDDIQRAWWIPKKIPVYLFPNISTNLSGEAEMPVKTVANDLNVVPEHPEPVVSTESAKLPIELIQFTKYQQPEPRDPNGIRFPATIPLNRNKVNIQPRSESSDLIRNTIFRWINVY